MKWMLASMAVTALASSALPAAAAGPFDGTWVVEAPALPGASSETSSSTASCYNAVRFEFQIRDNQVVGTLRQTPYAGVQQGGSGSSRAGAAPLQGMVQPDGTLTAQWQSYRATGKLTGDRAELTWRGQCGPRTATGQRVGG